MSVKSEIESLLFVSSRPLSARRLAEVTGHDKKEVQSALEELIKEYDARPESGLAILRNGDEVQFATAPAHADLVKDFLKDETFGELTRPALETLTIVAYRGPLTKAELEQIRGVNCSLILRNLLIRGLVETIDGSAPGVQNFRVTFDFVRYLGIREVAELPEYETLRSDENLRKLIEGAAKPKAAPAAAPEETTESV
jgi:segregation and condensation protein B